MFKIARILAAESLTREETNSDVLNLFADNLVSNPDSANVEEIHSTVLKLIYYKGCTLDEAAASSNISKDILKNKMVNTIKQLRGVIAT